MVRLLLLGIVLVAIAATALYYRVEGTKSPDTTGQEVVNNIERLENDEHPETTNTSPLEIAEESETNPPTANAGANHDIDLDVSRKVNPSSTFKDIVEQFPSLEEDVDGYALEYQDSRRILKEYEKLISISNDNVINQHPADPLLENQIADLQAQLQQKSRDLGLRARSIARRIKEELNKQTEI